MDVLVDRGNIPMQDLKSFNRVRCHLQIFSISDVVTADGKKISSNAYNGGYGTLESKWNWHEERPTAKDFSIWRSLLDTFIEGGKSLITPLGSWIQLPHQKLTWLYDSSTDYLYQCNKSEYTQFFRAPGGSRTQQLFHYKMKVPMCPNNLSLVTVNPLTEDVVIVEGVGPSMGTLPSSLQTLDETYTWAQKHCANSEELGKGWISHGLSMGTLRAVCDGSYKPLAYSNGITASWIIEDASQNHKVYGQAAIAGIKADAYRAELLGILTLISAIYLHEKKAVNYTKGSLVIGCDNKMAGWLSAKPYERTGANVKHMDIIKAIRRTQLLICTHVSFVHIYGHQDNHTEYRNLDRLAQLNVQVDAIAQQHFDDSYIDNLFIKNASLPNEGWYITLGSIKIPDQHKTHYGNGLGNIDSENTCTKKES